MNEMPANIALTEDGEAVRIVDQTLLPGQLKTIDLRDALECHDAIARLAVRGAPALGVFAGYAFYVLAQGIARGRQGAYAPDDSPTDPTVEVDAGYLEHLQRMADYLDASRPTAVNLHWGLSRMMDCAEGLRGEPAAQALGALRQEADAIWAEDVERCTRISEYGLGLVQDGWGIITHCNAGPLATSKYGTSTGFVFLGAERGVHFKVFADETRPLLQGARLTSYELDRAGIDVTLICDNMASIVMSQGWVQACFVGCDRVAANGDTANKVGTSGLAIIAKHYGVPFYVMCPTSTLDYRCATGADIPIELRDGDEIKTMWYEHPMAPQGVKCYNPSFDVTDHSLITAIVTEKGVCYPPFSESLAAIR